MIDKRVLIIGGAAAGVGVLLLMRKRSAGAASSSTSTFGDASGYAASGLLDNASPNGAGSQLQVPFGIGGLTVRAVNDQGGDTVSAPPANVAPVGSVGGNPVGQSVALTSPIYGPRIYERQYTKANADANHPSGSNAFFLDAGATQGVSIPYGAYPGGEVVNI